MMNPTLTIIVPIYNVEEYLNQCIDSILTQPYTDFELILVDDGSPDKCGDICDSYALIDERIIVIHKENGGLSSARNAGIDIARGEYLSFIDSDDFISKDYYLMNMEYLLSHPQTDMIIMQVCHFDKKTNIVKENNAKEYDNKYDAVGYLLSIDYICSAWINIYKKKVFKLIRYPDGQIFEDGFVLPDIANRINCLYVSDVGIYYYRQRNNSIMRNKRSELCWNDVLKSHVRILDYCYVYPDSKKRFLDRYKGFSLDLIYAMIEYPNESFQEFIDKFQKYEYNLKQLFKIKASLKDKIKLYVLNIFGFKVMIKIYLFFDIYKVVPQTGRTIKT